MYLYFEYMTRLTYVYDFVRLINDKVCKNEMNKNNSIIKNNDIIYSCSDTSKQLP